MRIRFNSKFNNFYNYLIMSNMISIVGKSGSGKSHSISTLNPKETFLISISGKKLPMRGFDKYYTNFSKNNLQGNKINTSNAKTIGDALNYINKHMLHVKNVVIDDRDIIKCTNICYLCKF